MNRNRIQINGKMRESRLCKGGDTLKTFELISFHILKKNGDLIQVPFQDALIINKENEKNTWLIELFTEQKNLSFFEDIHPNEEFPAYVVITKADNNPAVFLVKIIKKKIIDEFVSVLLEGRLHHSADYPVQLLEKLLNQGLSGQDLLIAFQNGLQNRKERLGK